MILMHGYQFFVAGLVIYLGVALSLRRRLGEDDPDLIIFRMPFQNLMTVQIMIIMAIALMFAGAMRP